MRRTMQGIFPCRAVRSRFGRVQGRGADQRTQVTLKEPLPHGRGADRQAQVTLKEPLPE